MSKDILIGTVASVLGGIILYYFFKKKKTTDEKQKDVNSDVSITEEADVLQTKSIPKE